MVAQKLGFPLTEIAGHLAHLPDHKAPSKADWARIAKQFSIQINARIAALQTLRDTLGGCIGCGCLSLDVCALYNPADVMGKEGPGPRKLHG